MEKKTIGHFISVLRRANGMTQKDLAEKLFVSDKTVSRWECDESTPDLALIPVIAEIFGITADELLRGEKNSPSHAEDTSSVERQKAKSEKQYQHLLNERGKKFRYLSAISIGLSVLALISAFICNTGFIRGVLGFGIACICLLASEICQYGFCAQAWLSAEDDDIFLPKIQKTNSAFLQYTGTITVINVLLFCFCLPLGLFSGIHGLTLFSWFLYGALLLILGGIVLYLLYHLIVKDLLIKRNLLHLEEKALLLSKSRRHFLKKAILVLAVILAILLLCTFVVNCIGYEPFLEEQVFYSAEEFKAAMEADYDAWFEEGWGPFDQVPDDIDLEQLYEDQKSWRIIQTEAGDVICEYYYAAALYEEPHYVFNDGVPEITVCSRYAFYDAYNIYSTMLQCLFIAAILSSLICVTVYGVQVTKAKKALYK